MKRNQVISWYKTNITCFQSCKKNITWSNFDWSISLGYHLVKWKSQNWTLWYICIIHSIHRFKSSDWIKEGHMTWIIFDNVHVWKLVHVCYVLLFPWLSKLSQLPNLELNSLLSRFYGSVLRRGVNREGFNFKLAMVKTCSTWPLLNKYAL